MKQLLTDGIILSRTDYGEADRIITVITPEQGKLRLMARGVRRVKSKLAGGIELFSTSRLTYIQGKGDIDTLISTRLIKYYGTIVTDIDRVQLGYELIKLLNKVTEDYPEAGYYNLLEETFAALDSSSIDQELIRTWFEAGLLRLAGHSPNLATDVAGNKLAAGGMYNFDFDSMSFAAHSKGRFAANDIKVLRLLFSNHTPADILKVQGVTDQLAALSPLIRSLLHASIPL